MKKISILLILLLIMTGCKNTKSDKKIEVKREERTLLTCEVDDVTYMFYYDKEEEPYYKAVYLETKIFKNEEAAEKYQEKFVSNWKEKYQDTLIEYDMRINENTSFINVSAIHDTDENMYKDFFGDRYNLNMEDMNKTFNNDCLIKPIKK